MPENADEFDFSAFDYVVDAIDTVTAKIDKASGHITDFDFLTPSVLHFDQVTAAVVVKVSNCNIGLLFHQTWTVTY